MQYPLRAYEALLYVLCIIGSMAGCGKTVWEHPVKGSGGLQQDLTECEKRADQAVQDGDPHTGNVPTVQDYINTCLRAQGYVERSSRP